MAEWVRENIPISARRDCGMFFSGMELASELVGSLGSRPNHPCSVLDPAVGSGDLLLAYANNLPVRADLESTLVEWSNCLHGVGIHPELVVLTKARLTLLALARGAEPKHGRLDPQRFFPGITSGDGLDTLSGSWDGDLVLMNPPFTYRGAGGKLSWSSGRTNSAAIFAAGAVEAMRPGARLCAILSDVLRTGTRYRRFRELVISKLKITAIEPKGRFDAWTDVDVFPLRGVARRSRSTAPGSSAWWEAPTSEWTISDFFEVSVGPVVPHRTSQSGAPERFISARNIPLGGVYDVAEAEYRNFRARSVTPPFVGPAYVATSRTSSRARDDHPRDGTGPGRKPPDRA